MRLSKLHIAGFKSFPDRSELGFDDGVTAIVGPNGCGKSNVVDAITWVLGEQSAKSLRGERMEDVIFSGSDIRKPTAAAEVRLKFTQVAQATAMAAPGPEPVVDLLLDRQPLLTRDVEIGRRLYRSGESEYLIDGEVCRLRDIHDLLMDSGLGVKAYAVIEQGKIGQILSSRPAERRMLIEEAAGVTKYKSRRRAAELKLEAAEQNLTRIDDIIFEVEKQRGALKRQAARARRYKRLREELRTWEQVQFARRYDRLDREIAAAAARLEEARAREVAAAARVSAGEMALEVARLAYTAAEAEATATRGQGHAKELEIGRHQQQAAFDRQQIEDLTRQADGYAAELIELEARREPAARVIETQKAAAAAARETVAEAARRLVQREAEYAQALAAVQAVERDADEARTAVMAASTAVSALQQARDHAAATRDRVAADRERLDQEARELETEAAATARARDEAVRALDQSRAALEETVSRRTALETTLGGRRVDRDRLVQALGARERELAAREARLRSLEELETRRARFGDAARLLLAEAGEACRQRGAVADQLEVARSYERAVDALLGERLQYVLVDAADDLTAALALIADRKAGRCGFIVLDAATAAPAAPVQAAAAPPPGARTLADVVRAIGPHAPVIARLLRPALIVESFDRARALAATVNVPVATTGGDVFRGGWLVQSGSRQEAHGILETRAEVSSLRDDVQAAIDAGRVLTAELADLDRAIAGGENAVRSLVADQHGHEKAIVGFDARVVRAAEDQARLARRLGVVGTERARTEEELTRADARRDDAAATIVVRQADQRTAEEALGRVFTGLQAARDTAEAAMRVMADSRAEQATLVERVSGLDQEVIRLEEAACDLQARVEGRQDDRRRIEARCAQLRESIAGTERALDEAGQALGGLTRALGDLDDRVARLRQELSDREQAIRGDRQALEAVRADVLQWEVARATATADLAHLAAACLEAVGTPLEAVAEAVSRLEAAGALVAPSRRTAPGGEADGDSADDLDEPTEVTEVTEVEEAGDPIELAAESAGDPRARDAAPESPLTNAEDPVPAGPIDPEPIIADLRRKIDRLGPVNMMAIEQFDELENRHSFLSTQRQDLLDSIAQTGEAIKKIELTTRQRFADAFASINQHFEQTFTTLFGGGRAGLVLIDHENEPDSGIDIIAQPPGKRLQNVQLLSGGEKALTAMALMFAVFKYRPSPFCLLDEIDAPLDDANIGRFVEMLQGMQGHTQFILITHNRKTMEIADRLYGVTMEEPGVSKLISIQLN